MRTIIANTIGSAHDAVIRNILDYSTLIVTEDGETTIDPGEPISIRVEHPLMDPMISSASLFGEGFANEYKNSFYTVTPRKGDGLDPTYTYGNRLCDYFTPYVKYYSALYNPVYIILDAIFGSIGYRNIDSIGVLAWHGDGRYKGINQIDQSIINRIVKSPATRRAVAITWSPNHDINESEPPCLQIVHCRIRPHTTIIDLNAVFRSNDMLSAWGQNAYGLAHLLKHIVDEINRIKRYEMYTLGCIETISLSPHIYSIRDCYELSRFVDKFKIIDKYATFQKT